MMDRPYHTLLLTNVGCDQVVQEKESISIDRHENMILKVGDKTAIDTRLVFCETSK